LILSFLVVLYVEQTIARLFEQYAGQG
jgi:hypothetical protein